MLRMLINFALESLGSTVSSDKVSVDGHECTNLISQDLTLRRKGYLAEHFLRPPVTLTFHFPCNVCIHKVVLVPSVGQQKSNLLELLCASQLQYRETLHLSQMKKAHIESRRESHSNSSTNFPPPVFYTVSKVFSNGDETCFYNPKVVNLNSELDTFKKQIAMRHFKSEMLTAASHLTIKILSTLSGSAAALSKIDIWGLPSNSVQSHLKEKIFTKYVNFLKPECSSSLKNENHKQDCGDLNISQGKIEIPEEFLDSLTWEVMTIPILLPSGKNIDKSTLDTYIAHESVCCKKPRDPFTGIEFSDSIKPLPNLALKARIDQFLMKNSSDQIIGTVPRTVSDGLRTLLGKRKVTGQRVNQNLLSTPCISDVDRHNTHRLHQTIVKECTIIVPNAVPANTDTGNSSHETQLKDSLNSALFSILHDLPSSVNETNVETVDVKCCSCVQKLSNETIVYQLPCSHVVCRTCLFLSPLTIFKCSLCTLGFEKKMIVRKH
uniref:U-box domain-containing protein n=1 Tax=Biomphalaria glabrata TaxID=6526 RepID=A0A2C9LFD6_BIOGL